MNAWTDDEEERDALDPSAVAVSEDSPELPDMFEHDPLVSELGPGEWDATKTVGVWVDGDKRLCRVRLASRWRDRASKGSTLAGMFLDCMLLAQMTIAEGAIMPTIEVDPEPFHEQPSPEAFARRRARLAEITERLVTLPPYRLEGGGSEGRAARGRVTVTLGQLGYTSALTIDDAWLADATTGQVTEAILAAHEDAYKNFVPPQLVGDERIELQKELSRISHEIDALMARI